MHKGIKIAIGAVLGSTAAFLAIRAYNKIPLVTITYNPTTKSGSASYAGQTQLFSGDLAVNMKKTWNGVQLTVGGGSYSLRKNGKTIASGLLENRGGDSVIKIIHTTSAV